jgi:hypothetical protein
VSIATAVLNPGFESFVLADGQYTSTFSSSGNAISTPDPIPGWSLVPAGTSTVGTFNPATTQYPDEAPEGQNVAYANGNGFGQLLPYHLEPDNEYRLEVEVGRRSDNSFPGYDLELRAGGNLLVADAGSLSPAPGTFETSVVTFTADPSDPNLGGQLEVVIRSDGNQPNFDDVRLTGIVETASVAGPASSRDSVDGDDGTIDGNGNGGHSLFDLENASEVVFRFDSAVLGGLPTHAGVVWTDAASPTQVTLELFDAAGASAGVFGPFSLGDAADDGGTAEDRFLGASLRTGISAIRIAQDAAGLELDHLQYGVFDPDADLDADGLDSVAERGAGTRIDLVDTDGDGFIDGDEVDFDSDPADPASIPSVVTEPSITEASAPALSILNEIDPTQTPGVGDVEITQASGAAVSVLNEIDPTQTPGVGDVEITQASGAAVSVLNEIDPTQTPGVGGVEITQASGAAVSVSNEIDPTQTPGAEDVEITEASGAAVSVLNEIDPTQTPGIEDVEITESSGAAVSVLNEVDPVDVLPVEDTEIGSAASATVSVEDEATMP